MKKIFLATALAPIVITANAHDIWIKPDAFQLYSDEQSIYSIDVSRSAEPMIAEANHYVKNLYVTAPSGVMHKVIASYSGKNKEVFEAEFREQGTHIIRAEDTQVYLSFYKDAEGKRHKVRMKKSEQNTLPEGSVFLKTVEKKLSSETYVHFNGISELNVDKTSSGISIVPLAHPAKFTVDQPVKFKIYLDGKPVDEAEVALKSAALSYFSQGESLELEHSEDGVFEFDVDQPGQYLLGVEVGQKLKGDSHADFRSIEKFLTFDIKK